MSFGSFGKPATTTGFGGTTAPNSSPFGQQQQQPQQTSLFGSTNTTAPAQGGSSLFGGQQSTPAASGSLFGQQQQQPQAQGSSLFGQQQSTGTTGGGLFGSQPAASTSTGGLFGQQQQQPQQNTGGGLFGQQQQQPQQNTSSLFGGAQQQSGTSSLFGQQQQQQQPQQGSFGSFGAKPATSLFGQQSTTTQPSGGLFGQQQQQQQPSTLGQSTTGGLFGQQSTAQPSTGLFGQQNKSMFGQPAGGLGQSQQAQSQSSGLGKTRLADLPEDVQKQIEQLDAEFKDKKQIGASIDMSTIGRAIWQTSADVKAASDEQAAIAQGLYSLRASLEQLATRVNEQATDLQKLLETWEAAKPLERRSAHIRPLAHRDFPQEFFYRVAKSLDERVNRYKRNIMLLNRAIAGLANDSETLTPQVVAQTIQNNQSAIISLAAQLDQLQLRMNTLRAEFTEDYREKTNSMRDPFEVAREEKGVSLLRA